MTLDEAIGRLENTSDSSPFTRIAAIVALKGRNLALASFSLTLDGLAQEAGALLRPLLEAIELLTYLREDPHRAEQLLNNKLPRAGEIAKLINGKFGNLKRYLNEHSAHFAVTFESVRHVIDFEAGTLRRVQPFNEKVLRENLKQLYAFLMFLLLESVNCFQVQNMGTANDLADRFDQLKLLGREVFNIP